MDLSECNDNITTITDKYTLTDTEEKLLEVLINPLNRGKNVSEKCQIAGISRDSYYRIIKQPHFIELRNRATIELIKDRISDVVGATIEYATSNSRCAADRRILLEMSGLYMPKQENSITGEINIGAYSLNDDQRQKRIDELRKKQKGD